MSILITAIDHFARGVYMAADNRSVDLEGNLISDDVNKVFKLREGLLLGISGLTSECLEVLNELRTVPNLHASELISIAAHHNIENIPGKDRTHGVVLVLAGIYDDGEPFIWSRDTHDKIEEEPTPEKIDGFTDDVLPGSLVKGETALLVSAPSVLTADAVRGQFVTKVIKYGGDYSKAMMLSVAEASDIDSSISPSADIHTVDTVSMNMYSKHFNFKKVKDESTN